MSSAGPAAELDAIVVGAGLSGLVCARRLRAGGARVLVLEARDRVGGRLSSAALAGSVVDLGGQWMSSGQDRLVALARELELASFAQPRVGRALLDEPPGGWLTQLARAVAQLRAMRRLTRMARALPAGAAAGADGAAALDARSLEDWLAREVRSPIVRARIALHADLVLAADRSSLSLLHYLATLGATGGFGGRGPELPGGGLEHCFTEGAQALALRLAAPLGEALQLAAPVRAIEQDTRSVAVRTATATYRARRLVLALPPALARGIEVALPEPAQLLRTASQPGAVVKCFAAYAEPFWRARGCSGESYQPTGTVRATVELAAPGGAPGLLAFVVGPPAQAWAQREAAARKAEILATLVARFGEPAATPIDYLEHDWGADPWSAGCVAGLPPGALTAGARWREPHGRIHFAGTETAHRWPGYMEGAIEAGERAASEVLSGDPRT